MTFTKEQIISALIAEHEFYSHDMDLPMTLPEFTNYLNGLTMEQLIYETSTDEHFTLDEFMDSYS
jgi:hypothetical protein